MEPLMSNYIRTEFKEISAVTRISIYVVKSEVRLLDPSKTRPYPPPVS